MKGFIGGLLVTALLSGTASAQTEIHRCPQEDGTIAFQETPCAEVVEVEEPDPASEEPDPASEEPDPVDEYENPFDEPISVIVESAPEPVLPPPASNDRAECEKMARDSIDAIDLEMRQTSYTKEEGQAYLAELRTLTQQLRACKTLTE